jgi:hypothetical protein
MSIGTYVASQRSYIPNAATMTCLDFIFPHSWSMTGSSSPMLFMPSNKSLTKVSHLVSMFFVQGVHSN